LITFNSGLVESPIVFLIPSRLFNESTFSFCANARGKPAPAKHVIINKQLNNFAIFIFILNATFCLID
jgi:hypothetical protein